MEVIFRDDFSAPTLDASKWSSGWFPRSTSDITKPVNGAEIAAYDPRCVTIRNGRLHLHLKHVKVRASNGTTYPESTGCVTTMGKFVTPKTDYTVEARIELPGTADALYNWPAFWLDGTGTWPQTGENDIMEGLGGRAAWHYHSPSGGPGGSVTMGAGWHDLKCEIAGGNARYSYDGKYVGTLAIVQAPQFVILGNQSGSYGGQDVESDMKVDWVQVTTP